MELIDRNSEDTERCYAAGRSKAKYRYFNVDHQAHYFGRKAIREFIWGGAKLNYGIKCEVRPLNSHDGESYQPFTEWKIT